jgi:hypothetical protein
MRSADPTLIAVNPVLAERADDFEEWLRTVVVPAVRAHRPEMEGRWQVLRSGVVDDGVVPFVFLFAGGDPAEWDLQPLLEKAHGTDGAAPGTGGDGGDAQGRADGLAGLRGDVRLGTRSAVS